MGLPSRSFLSFPVLLSPDPRALRASRWNLFLLLAWMLSGSVAHALTIKATYDPSVAANLSAANVTNVKNAVAAVISELEGYITNPITVNITVAAAAGTSTLGASDTYYQNSTYTQVKGALSAHKTSANDATAVSHLPASDPAGSGGWSVYNANAKALGLLAANGTATDGTFTFGAGNPYTFDPNNRAVSGKYDFMGVALHEFSEILGRNTSIDTSPAGASPFDLFRYTTPGKLDLTTTSKNVHFSIDGGATDLNTFNSTSGGDLQDWAGPTPDAFNAFATTGKKEDLTSSDLTALDVIGYTVVPEPGSALLAVSGAALLIARRRRGLS